MIFDIQKTNVTPGKQGEQTLRLLKVIHPYAQKRNPEEAEAIAERIAQLERQLGYGKTNETV
jgi:PHD/YefM family antitoxin component YafN of YafNO toxin-antitoxin module